MTTQKGRIEMIINLKKVHGSSNDFYIIDENGLETPLTEESRRQLALNLCDREHDLGGADGILYVSDSEVALAKMRVINSDGSEASMCGNGLRTVARYLAEKADKKQFKVETMKAVLNVAEDKALAQGVPTYCVEISPVSFEKESLPLNWTASQLIDAEVPAFSETLTYSAVSVPNPHLISFVEPADFAEQEQLSTWLNSDNPYFPDGVNVSYVQAIDSDTIFVKTFERGVGFTNACGTAMSASSLMARLLNGGEMTKKVDVYNPGGRVQCQVYQTDEGYTIDLIGNATFSFDAKIVISEDFKKSTVIEQVKTDEEIAYQKMAAEAARFVAEHQHA